MSHKHHLGYVAITGNKMNAARCITLYSFYCLQFVLSCTACRVADNPYCTTEGEMKVMSHKNHLEYVAIISRGNKMNTAKRASYGSFAIH